MPKGPLLLASFGLALNLVLWGIPGMVATAAAAHLVTPSAPALSTTLARLGQNPGSSHSLLDGLVQVVGAESEALQVAGAALQQPTPTDLAPRANAAGAHVETALQNYLTAAQVLLNR